MRITPIVAGAVFVLTACSHRDRETSPSNVRVSFDSAAAAASASESLGPGDVRVTSTDGAMVLSLVGDSVRMQLSDSLRNKVRHEIDTAGGGGIGGMITRSVSGIVGSAMGFVVRIPVREIDDVRYENGKIQFGSHNGKSHFSLGGNDRSNGDSHAEFSASDGERFVAAVKRRQAELGVPNAR